jgi:hypothetical protein
MARHIQHSLHHLAEAALGPQWRVIGRVLEHWEDVVGKEWAQHACPTGVKPIPRPVETSAPDQAKLFVRIPGALAPQFQMMEHTMRARINQLLGYEFITAIIFEHQIGAKRLGD